MSEEEKIRDFAGNSQSQNYYGTFQGVANYYPPFPLPPNQEVVGLPQPIPPPGTTGHPQIYGHAYKTVTGYAIIEGRPVRECRLSCCGVGMGCFLVGNA